MFRLVCFAAMLLIGCSLDDNSSSMPPDREAPPDPNATRAYSSYLLGDFEVNLDGIWSLREDQVEGARDVLRFYEKNYLTMHETLVHGYVPEVYLDQNPIEYVDKTAGALKGLEKLTEVWERIYGRCPVIESYKAPLQVHWVGRDSPAYDQDIGGSYSGRVGYYTEFAIKKYVANALAPEIVILGEIESFTWPKQTFFEQFGYNEWEWTTQDIKTQSGPALDVSFAHEIGHFFLESWAMHKGRSLFQSWHFAEGIAEIFSKVCFGSTLESPYYESYYNSESRKKELVDEILFQSSQAVSMSKSGLYYPHELRGIIAWEALHGRFLPGKTMAAVISTLDDMKGRHIKCPPDSVKGGSYPWSSDKKECLSPEDGPLVFTRGEFAEKFCDHYPCPAEFIPIFAAASESLRESEW